MSEWFTTLDSLHGQVWSVLAHGVADRHHPARNPTLATVSPGGWPEARTVVLRDTDAVARTLSIHTDTASDKIASLQASPRAALHVWVPKLDLQIRIQAQVEIETGPKVRKLWEAVPDRARQAYGTQPSPGTIIPDSTAYEKPSEFEAFAVLVCHACVIDALHLGEVHRRARFARTGDWQGQWLAP